MSKPMSAAAVRLLETAPRLEKSPHVCPSIFDPNQPMSKHTYYKGWRRILKRAGLPRIGTHGHPASLGDRYRQLRNPRESRHGTHGAQNGHHAHALRPHRG
jgi:integrase